MIILHYIVEKIYIIVQLFNFLDQKENQEQTFDNSVILNGHLGNEENHTLDQPETPNAETNNGIERLTLETDEDNDEIDNKV